MWQSKNIPCFKLLCCGWKKMICFHSISFQPYVIYQWLDLASPLLKASKYKFEMRKHDNIYVCRHIRQSCRNNLKKFTVLYQCPNIWNSFPVKTDSLSSFPYFYVRGGLNYKPGSFRRSPRHTLKCFYLIFLFFIYLFFWNVFIQ